MSLVLTKQWLGSCGGSRVGTHEFVFESCGPGPIFKLRIDLLNGCDGCSIEDEKNSVHIKMPETKSDFVELCESLGVKWQRD